MFDSKTSLINKKLAFALSVTFVCVMVIVFATVSTNQLCNRPRNETANDQVTVEASEDLLKLIVAMNKSVYKVGEEIDLAIQIVNISNSTVELFYGTPFVCPPIRFTVYDQENNTIYKSATYVQITVVLSYNKTLEPNQSLDLVKTWKQINLDGEQVPCGEYYFTTEIIPDALHVYRYINGTRSSFGTITIRTPALGISISN